LHRRTPFLCLMSAAFVIMWLAACQPGVEKTPEDLASQQVPSKEGSPTGAPQSTVNSTEIASASIQFIWEASPHANTYVLDDAGMNSTCARCHAPINYVPSMEDMPESCATCKFEVAPPPPKIAETDWKNIQCNICHRVKKGVVEPQYAWLSIPPIDEYEDLTTTTELCIKCHTVVDVAGHTAVDVAGAHAGYTCTQCHDAHSTTASCSTGSCHADALNPSTPIPGHDENHKAVTCWACHDAGGLAVGPNEEGNWLTFQTASSNPFVSHNIVKAALCERCHFLNNPWNLSADVPKTTP
jgi:hypothetical protein